MRRYVLRILDLATSLRKRLSRLSNDSPGRNSTVTCITSFPVDCAKTIGFANEKDSDGPRAAQANARSRRARKRLLDSAWPCSIVRTGREVWRRTRGLVGMRMFLCGWYAYLVVLAGLMAASAGQRTRIGRLALVALAAALLLLVALIRWPFGYYTAVTAAAQGVVLLVALLGVALAPRSDTRHIAVLLAAAAAVPLILSFWQPSG